MLIKNVAGVPVTYSFSQLREDNPNVSFREGGYEPQLNEWGVYKVTTLAKPVFDPLTQKLEEATPADSGGNTWTKGWNIVPLSAAELEAVQDETDATTIRADATVRALITGTPAQIENYINTNVTNLATAKEVLIILAKAISAIGKQQFK